MLKSLCKVQYFHGGNVSIWTFSTGRYILFSPMLLYLKQLRRLYLLNDNNINFANDHRVVHKARRIHVDTCAQRTETT